jgi:multimeric flavodoxin WrbA
MTRHFLFLVASTRPDGNTERLARRAAAALPPEVVQTWLRFDEHPLPPFVDTRHSGGFPPSCGALVDATLAATDLVFVTPVYWYSLPAAAKLYLDHWTAWMRDPALDFRARMAGRRLWAVVVDASDPGDGTMDPLIGMLTRTADYMDMRWMGALEGHGNRPGEAFVDPATLAAADAYFGKD